MTATNFTYALRVCGLTQQEAAAYLGKSLITVKSYSSGKRAPGIATWEQLTILHATQKKLAAATPLLSGSDLEDCSKLNLSRADKGIVQALAILAQMGKREVG